MTWCEKWARLWRVVGLDMRIRAVQDIAAVPRFWVTKADL